MILSKFSHEPRSHWRVCASVAGAVWKEIETLTLNLDDSVFELDATMEERLSWKRSQLNTLLHTRLTGSTTGVSYAPMEGWDCFRTLPRLTHKIDDSRNCHQTRSTDPSHLAWNVPETKISLRMTCARYETSIALTWTAAYAIARGVTLVMPIICATDFLFEAGPGLSVITDIGPVKMWRNVWQWCQLKSTERQKRYMHSQQIDTLEKTLLQIIWITHLIFVAEDRPVFIWDIPLQLVNEPGDRQQMLDGPE